MLFFTQFQGRHDVEHPGIAGVGVLRREFRELQVAEYIEAMIEGDHDDVALAAKPRAVEHVARPDREVKSPPCSQTITGRLPPSARPGVQTFRSWQSSLMSLSNVQEANSEPSGPRDCGHIGPKASASRTSVHGFAPRVPRTGGPRRRECP
jgi:hypothetical protein